MPATQQRIRCGSCDKVKTRSEMAVVGDMCLTCFDRTYRLCEGCGKVIEKICSVYDGTYLQDGLKLCYNCSETRRYDRLNWKPTPCPWVEVSYDEISSKRKFGVEIETSKCPEWEQLRGHTFFGAKNDCTINGKEFDSPVLYGDAGLDHLREFLAYAEQAGWEVDYDCGCHTHYDMRGLNYKQLCSVAYAYRKSVTVLQALVDPQRHDHEYCAYYHWTCADFKMVIEHADNFNNLLDRLSAGCYEYVRFHAYFTHNTFENRMLEGCLDAVTICAWIKLNCLFIDAVKDMSIAEIDEHFGSSRQQAHLEPMYNLIGDTDLIAWMRHRGEKNWSTSNPA